MIDKSKPYGPQGPTEILLRDDECVVPLTDRDRLKALDEYVEQIATLRSLANDASRRTYTVALGQLRRLDLIDEETWREALDRPRVER